MGSDPSLFLERMVWAWGVMSACVAVGFGHYVISEWRAHGADRLRLQGAIPIACYFAASAMSRLTEWCVAFQARDGVVILLPWASNFILGAAALVAMWAQLCMLRVFMRTRWGEKAWVIPLVVAVMFLAASMLTGLI